ncbi:hypothetical protein pb186bvf_014880 [Paramecium bursaria]
MCIYSNIRYSSQSYPFSLLLQLCQVNYKFYTRYPFLQKQQKYLFQIQ